MPLSLPGYNAGNDKGIRVLIFGGHPGPMIAETCLKTEISTAICGGKLRANPKFRDQRRRGAASEARGACDAGGNRVGVTGHGRTGQRRNPGGAESAATAPYDGFGLTG